MRNHRSQSSFADLRFHSVRWPLGILFATALWPLAAFGQGSPGKVKYLYKPTPCSPCPCQCPDPRDKAPNARVVASVEPGTAPAHRAAIARLLPALRTTAVASSEPQTPTSAASTATGSLGGAVSVRNRSGQEQADRSGVMVYIAEIPGKKYAPLKRPRELKQSDKSFVPGLVAITRGSAVNFPNEDKFYHNVFSLSLGNTFDLGLYSAGQSKSVTFEKTGVIDVYCNIHPNMWAQILVLDNPFFTTTETDGRFELSKLPLGVYTVVARTLGGEPVRQQVKIEAGKRAEVSLAVGLGPKVKAHNDKENGAYKGVYGGGLARPEAPTSVDK